MIFRQLHEPESSTYTYLLGCRETRQAVLVDPVVDAIERDLELLGALGLSLALTIDTHVHADHVTGACALRQTTGCRVAYPAMDALPCADLGVVDGVPVRVGHVVLHPLHTPGHTDSHHCYFVDGDPPRVFTGDTLLIDGCGRTDFQGGDSRALYRSVHEKLYTLPDDALVYPGHDYHGRRVSTIAQERARNPRLADGKSVEEFVALMAALALPYPRKIDIAVPANRLCGNCPGEVIAALDAIDDASAQG